MACQVQFVRVDTTYSIIMSSAKRIYYATTMWKGGHYIYPTEYQALSKAKIYGTLCNFVHRAICSSSAIDICPLWIKKLHVLLFLIELKPRT